MRVLVLLALVSAVSAGKWTNLCPIGKGQCPTIMLGLDCKDESLCAIVGGYTNTAESVYYSTDQFQTFNLANMSKDSLLLLDIAIDQKQGTGVTSGIGAPGRSILHSDDIIHWDSSKELKLVSGQDVESLGNGEFAFVGTLGGGQQGVLFSKDGGKDWVPAPWPADFASLTEVRYGGFVDEKVWYVAGGDFPSAPTPSVAKRNCHQISESTCVATNGKVPPQSPRGDGYYGLMTKTTDGGATWTQLFNTTDFYFNQVNCFDANTCVAAGEAHAGAAPGGYLLTTVDGGKTWKQFVDKAAGAGMFAAHMVSATEAWGAGGDGGGSTLYHTTDAGDTWTADASQLKLVGEIMGLSFINEKLGFAVGITDLQSSTVLKYTA